MEAIDELTELLNEAERLLMARFRVKGSTVLADARYRLQYARAGRDWSLTVVDGSTGSVTHVTKMSKNVRVMAARALPDLEWELIQARCAEELEVEEALQVVRNWVRKHKEVGS